jgi:hypothetical protein
MVNRMFPLFAVGLDLRPLQSEGESLEEVAVYVRTVIGGAGIPIIICYIDALNEHELVMVFDTEFEQKRYFKFVESIYSYFANTHHNPPL